MIVPNNELVMNIDTISDPMKHTVFCNRKTIF